MTILYYPTEKGSTSAEEIKDRMEDVIWREIAERMSFNEIEGYLITVNVIRADRKV